MRLRRALVLVLGVGGVASAGPDATHTGVETTPHFEVRYRPGSRAAAGVDRVAARAERDLEDICRGLSVPVGGRFRLYVYDDVHELSAITGTTGNAGFSTGDTTHVPYGDDDGRYHELVHLVAHALPLTGEAPGLFFAEGLANALLEFPRGVHVHDTAAFHAARGELPPLADLIGAEDFYGWLRAHPGVNGYDIAGSWFRHLLDAHGAKKVVAYYTGTPPRKAFGRDLAPLEEGWRKMLAAREVRPEVEVLLRRRAGEDVGFAAFRKGLPPEIEGEPEDWVSLLRAELRPAEPGCWKREGEALVGTADDGRWRVCELGTEEFGDCAVRIVAETPSPCALQVRLGEDNQAMLVNGVFIYRRGTPVAGVSSPAIGGARIRTELVVVRRDDRLEIWVDGVKALDGPAAADSARVGIGVAFSSATFREVEVRKLGS